MADARILVIADMHCGHKVGLTPPDWWALYPKSNPRQQKISAIQRDTWKWFAKEVDRLKPFTHLFCMGDAIDGKGERSGGTEQKTADRADQAEMAAYVINYAEAPVVVMVAGTPYHTGSEEDWEAEIVPKIKAKKVHFEGHAFPRINGVQFDLKHHIGNSTIPHGRFTAVARDKLWNHLWHVERQGQPNANVLIRAHIHELRYCGTAYWHAVTCPALQGYGSKYGVRRCSGTVDVGFLVYDVGTDRTCKRIECIAELPYQSIAPLQL